MANGQWPLVNEKHPTIFFFSFVTSKIDFSIVQILRLIPKFSNAIKVNGQVLTANVFLRNGGNSVLVNLRPGSNLVEIIGLCGVKAQKTPQ